MGPFPVMILTSCLSAFRWLLWAVAMLLSVLLVVQKLRNDADLRPGPELVAISAFLLAGWLTGWAVRRVNALSRKLTAVSASAPILPGAMAEVRQAIDALDDELVALLALRQRQIERAALIKPVLGIPARVPARVDQVLARVDAGARREGLAPEVAQTIWSGLIEWSIAYEERLMAGEKATPVSPETA